MGMGWQSENSVRFHMFFTTFYMIFIYFPVVFPWFSPVFGAWMSVDSALLPGASTKGPFHRGNVEACRSEAGG